MTTWRDDRNAAARRRLDHALPPVFPRAVLIHAHARPLIPPLPRLAVESYWRTHPLRADRLARALAALSEAPESWRWQVSANGADGRPRTFRTPPAPFREAPFTLGPGQCCICGQPVYRFGWHRDLWGTGQSNARATWHACCVAAWKLWTSPNDFGPMLRKVQKRRCGVLGQRLLKAAEIDHRVPLFEVWRDHREARWPDLLRYWGAPNLQAVNRPAHLAKCAVEAAARARVRAPDRRAEA